MSIAQEIQTQRQLSISESVKSQLPIKLQKTWDERVDPGFRLLDKLGVKEVLTRIAQEVWKTGELYSTFDFDISKLELLGKSLQAKYGIVTAGITESISSPTPVDYKFIWICSDGEELQLFSDAIDTRRLKFSLSASFSDRIKNFLKKDFNVRTNKSELPYSQYFLKHKKGKELLPYKI